MENKYDIFISYKEKDGEKHASQLNNMLIENGYTAVYYNTTKRKQGDFEVRLEEAIKSCTDFVLLLTPLVVESLLNKDCVQENKKDFDYVNWELSKACEYNKHILILSVDGACLSGIPDYKYDNIKNLRINKNQFGNGNEGGPLHTAETFALYNNEEQKNVNDKILNELKTDVTERMLLRRIICGVVSTAYEVNEKKFANCVFTVEALAAICDYITGDNSIATEIEECKDVESLNEYFAKTQHSILADFCQYFNFYLYSEDDNCLAVRLKSGVGRIKGDLKCDEILDYLYKSYIKKGELFHDMENNKKKFLDKTIGDYIQGVIHKGYFVKNKGKRMWLIGEIIPTLIRTHNHHQGYLSALIEKGKAYGEQRWLFCDINGDDEDKFCAQLIKQAFGEFYREMYQKSVLACNLVPALRRWFNKDEYFVNFCNWQLISEYDCHDAFVWNYLKDKRKYCQYTLADKFTALIKDGKKYKTVLNMLTQGLNYGIYYHKTDAERNALLLDLLFDVVDKIISQKIDEALAKTYCHGVCKTLSIFWKYDKNCRDKIKEVINRAYDEHKIEAFWGLHNKVNGKVVKTPVKDQDCEQIITDALAKTDSELLEDKLFVVTMDKIKVKQENIWLYNQGLSRLLDLCENNDFYGIGVLIVVPYKRKYNFENEARTFEIIKKFVCDENRLADLDGDKLTKLIKMFKYQEFSDIKDECLAFEIRAFKDIVSEETVASVKFDKINRVLTDDALEMLVNKLSAETVDESCKEAIQNLLNPNINKVTVWDWERALLYRIISRILPYDTFIKLDAYVQRCVVHYAKNKKEYSDEMAILFKRVITDDQVWNSFDASLKAAFVIEVTDFIEDFEQYKNAVDFIDEIISDISSLRKEYKEIKNKYVLTEETIVKHIIDLHKSKPWKTARLCAAYIVKIFGHVDKHFDGPNNNKETLAARKNLFPYLISNPCIREFVKFYASNFIDIVVRDDKKYDMFDVGVLADIVNKNKFPLWYGREVKPKLSFGFNGNGKMQKLTNCSFEDVVQDFDVFRSRDESEFEWYDNVLNQALETKIKSKKPKPIDLERDEGKILLWKDFQDDKMYVLTRKKLFARYFMFRSKYSGLTFNGLVYTPQMCNEIGFEEAVFDVETELEAVRTIIEEKFKDALIDNPAGSFKYNKVLKGKVGADVQRSINDFYYAYYTYKELTKTNPCLRGAFEGYVKQIKSYVDNVENKA